MGYGAAGDVTYIPDSSQKLEFIKLNKSVRMCSKATEFDTLLSFGAILFLLINPKNYTNWQFY